ncbi:MAG: hypothetical protein UR89_C0012G0002 [Candidatus Roizmanbacteria bacterium GW2011_GWA2_35_8]|uniref:Glycosyltransferase RgtA/B/C/D-like domain-containing protein n=1 Tax=Candidatus Roizmanbacteria bacterium GW2011_GWA2_35_8 TaxID=1618479 RepID=A0A0G0FH88_9BACT|nr:MAG: hypothetical protein UR89_C0012G0002 [Candidatus Roizmanbacteria bacterium GW2011_GWA2_35_8]
MKYLIKNRLNNISEFIIWIIVFFVSILSLLLSISNNSVKLWIHPNKESIIFNILDKNFKIPYKRSTRIKINFLPQSRYSTKQYLVEDCNPICSSIKILLLLLRRKEPAELKYQQNIFVQKKYLIFNPFRSEVLINDTFRLTLNIPDATLEVWESNNKLYSESIIPPWIQLIINPLVSSFSFSVILFMIVKCLFSTTKKHELKTPKKYLFDAVLNKYSPIIIFLVGTLVVGFIFIQVFKTMPGFGDEMNYLFQAKIFSARHIFVSEPANPDFFRISWMDIFGNDEKLWNFHPFGNSLILMIGQLINIRWITVPIIGGLILLAQYLLAKELFNNKKIALVHTLIIGLSHYFLSLASSYMAHAPSLLFISLFYLFLIKSIKTNSQTELLTAAASLGMAFIIRPLSAVLASFIPLLILLGYFFRNWKKISFKALIASGLIGIIIASTIFLYSFIVAGKWDFPYLIKGPEKGQTIELRLKKELNYKLSNLYRNANEFQNRVHSFGYLLNFTFFFIPLIGIFKNKRSGLILSGYLILFTYVIIHSWLHWYGWKWEPRMIYDISFIFYLLTTYGIVITYKNLRNSNIGMLIFISVLFLALLFLIFIDLPYRFKNEYMNYNFNPNGVRDKIKKEKISNAIIFFESEFVFGPYFPENNINFNGSIIYAINKNEDYNCILINKYPTKITYYSPDGQLLIKKDYKCN